ncbi:MAG: FecR domain-containing protein [Tannerella sp.]|jgi:ferric-dicitrate binding protein FerR (iron transport regulator)|nr:FecR domain-containing protein [Tannerella sp.]
MMNGTLLLRFLMRRCTPAELKQVEQWVAADTANADWLFEMERIWGLKDEWQFSEQQAIENAYKRFVSGLQKVKTANESKPAKSISLVSLLKYAAAIIVMGLLSVNVYYMQHKDRPQIAMNTVEVPKGQRVALTLSDGTKVWLNSQSAFTYPSDFADGNREVTLTGEGFFEVAPDKNKPFIVHSSLMEIKVLGTKFDLKSYPGESSFVTLAEGEVEVSTSGAQVRLKPNQQFFCSGETGLTEVKQIDPSLVNSWTTGELNFTDQPLSAIAADLERRFDVQIHIQDQTLAEDIFTCHVKETATVEQILHFLKETKRLNYKINGQEIQIIKYNMPMKKR